jgi:hypothetical protein
MTTLLDFVVETTVKIPDGNWNLTRLNNLLEKSQNGYSPNYDDRSTFSDLLAYFAMYPALMQAQRHALEQTYQNVSTLMGTCEFREERGDCIKSALREIKLWINVQKNTDTNEDDND